MTRLWRGFVELALHCREFTRVALASDQVDPGVRFALPVGPPPHLVVLLRQQRVQLEVPHHQLLEFGAALGVAWRMARCLDHLVHGRHAADYVEGNHLLVGWHASRREDRAHPACTNPLIRRSGQGLWTRPCPSASARFVLVGPGWHGSGRSALLSRLLSDTETPKVHESSGSTDTTASVLNPARLVGR